MVDRAGIPLAALLTGANRHDSVVFEALIDAIPSTKTPAGQRRKRPSKLHADKAYDIPRCRIALRRRHIRIRIARKGIDSGLAPGSSPLGGGAHLVLAQSLPPSDRPL